jgi:hypothetical protein
LRGDRIALALPLDGSISDSLQDAPVSVLSSGDVTPACERLHMDSSADVARLAAIAIPDAPNAAVDDPYDYGSDADPDQEAIARAFADLDKLTLQAERATEARKRAEDQLQKCKQLEERLLNKEIPELLSKMRLDECVTASGIEVKVKREIRASLPGHDRIEARMGALRWLVDHGHGGVIKNSVSVALDRGQDTRADDLVVELRAKGFDVEAKKDVHAQTLAALVRELMGEGKVVPSALFNIFDQRLAKLTRK